MSAGHRALVTRVPHKRNLHGHRFIRVPVVVGREVEAAEGAAETISRCIGDVHVRTGEDQVDVVRIKREGSGQNLHADD